MGESTGEFLTQLKKPQEKKSRLPSVVVRALGAVAVSMGGVFSTPNEVNAPAITPNIMEMSNRESVIEIENEFGIRIPGEIDAYRLRMLKHFLSYLPEHFYRSKKKGEEVNFSPNSVQGLCDCRDPRNTYINLGGYQFSPDDPERAFSHLAHELTHLVERNLFFPDFPVKITELRKNYSMKVKEKMNQGNDRTDSFYNSLRYGLYGNTPVETSIEFVPTLAESYVLGKEHFYEMYSKVFPPELVDTAYNFMRDKVFLGREYEPLDPPNFFDPNFEINIGKGTGRIK